MTARFIAWVAKPAAIKRGLLCAPTRRRTIGKQTLEIAMSKRSAFHLCVIGLGVATLWVSAQAGQRQTLSVEKITANLCIIIGNGGNVAMMPTNDGVLLVDDKSVKTHPTSSPRSRSSLINPFGTSSTRTSTSTTRAAMKR